MNEKLGPSRINTTASVLQELLVSGLRHHRAGQLAEAERCYRDVLAIEPRHAQSLHLLGMIAYQGGRLGVAVELMGEARDLEPDNPEPHYNLGNALRDQGNLKAAEASFGKALKLNPGFAEAHYNLGNVLMRLDRREEAIGYYRNALGCKPDYPEAHFNLGNVLRDQGEVEEAVSCFREAIRLRPEFAEANYNLGSVLLEQGRLEEAGVCYRTAIAHRPDYAEAYGNLGNALMNQGRLGDAVASFRKALDLRVDIPVVHYNLGNALRSQGSLDEAVASYRQALLLKPDFADAHWSLGNALAERGKLDEAVLSYRRAIEHRPEDPGVHFSLGSVLMNQGSLEEAIACFRKTLALRPNDPEAHGSLGNALKDQGKLDTAVAAYRRALDLRPNFPEVYSNLGNVLKDQGRLEEAAASYRKAIDLKSEFPEAHSNLGIVLQDQGNLDEAMAYFRKAIELKPDYAHAYYNLGIALKDRSRMDEAISYYRKGIELRPDLLEAHNNLLMTLHYSELYSGKEILTEAQNFARQVEHSSPRKDFANTPDADRRLRVGYVSADFRAHPVGYFLARVLAAYDRAAIEVFCYSNTAKVDDTTARLAAAADHWRILSGVSDTEAASVIRRDEIDILVDLSGHTAGNRLPLFATKPAPILVTWLGYFGTTGLTSMDYILADRFVAPPGTEASFVETVWRLPDSYLCFAPPEFDVPIVARSLSSREPLTLGCFNNWSKISAGTIALWARILARLPGSQLLLKAKFLDNPAVLKEALGRFATHGIDPNRLILEGPSPRPDLLAAYNRVDIALDPFPYGGGTTTAEALWMGVPVVTLRGDRWVGRVSESILRAVGLPELVAENADAYAQRVVALAHDRPYLGRLRRTLRQTLDNSSFCDGPRFTHALEMGYREMWKTWCSSRTSKGK